MSPHRLAYFAGLFEGEGCVGVYHQPKQRSSCLRVQVVQNLRAGVVESFEELAAAFGGKVRYQKTRTAKTKVCYDAGGDSACAFLEAIWPSIHWKREEVALGIAWHTQRLPRRRDHRGRVLPRDESDVRFALAVAEVSSALKRWTLAEVQQMRDDWARAVELLGLSGMLSRSVVDPEDSGDGGNQAARAVDTIAVTLPADELAIPRAA